MCEGGGENLVTIKAHTPDGSDPFLHYLVGSQVGQRIPLRTWLADDGDPRSWRSSLRQEQRGPPRRCPVPGEELPAAADDQPHPAPEGEHLRRLRAGGEGGGPAAAGPGEDEAAAAVPDAALRVGVRRRRGRHHAHALRGAQLRVPPAEPDVLALPGAGDRVRGGRRSRHRARRAAVAQPHLRGPRRQGRGDADGAAHAALPGLGRTAWSASACACSTSATSPSTSERAVVFRHRDPPAARPDREDPSRSGRRHRPARARPEFEARLDPGRGPDVFSLEHCWGRTPKGYRPAAPSR